MFMAGVYKPSPVRPADGRCLHDPLVSVKAAALSDLSVVGGRLKRMEGNN